jgi:hypothetical protein
MTNTERLEHNPELQAFCMAAALSHRGMLELMHSEEDIEKALSSFNEFKDFQKRAQERRKPFEEMAAIRERVESIDYDVLRATLEKRSFSVAVSRVDPPLPQWFVQPTDEEPLFKELRVTGFGPE